MAERFFPPHFVEVSLASLLVSAPLTYGMAAAVAADAAGSREPAAQAAATAPADQRAEERPQRPSVPYKQVIADRRLAHKIVVRKAQATVSKRDLAEFRRTVRAFEQSGQRIGLVICDLSRGSELTYDANELFYPASSVKGPYVIALYERLVDTGRVAPEEIRDLVEPTIVDSNNETYLALRERFGDEVFAEWAVSCGAIEEGGDAYRRLSTENYPDLTPRQLARMWRHAFTYLKQDGDTTRELVGLFERRVESPIREGVADGDLTITKAGWYPADMGPEFTATVDAGIVLDSAHGYVVVIMTDAPADLDELAELVPGIFSARAVLE